MLFDALPIIVVTAQTQTAADEFITELIDEDVTAAVRPAEHPSADRVWRLRTRYYEADVRVSARAPGAAGGARAAGHVLVLDEEEAREAGATRARLEELGARPADACVVACRVRALPAHVRAECARRMVERVALLDEAEGVRAVRASLHANAWPGMRRLPRAGEEAGAQAEEVERVERFAAVLGALGGAAEAVRELRGAERRAAAEHLVAAFAAALEHDEDL